MRRFRIIYRMNRLDFGSRDAPADFPDHHTFTTCN